MDVSEFLKELNLGGERSATSEIRRFQDLCARINLFSIVERDLHACLGNHRHISKLITSSTLNLLSGDWFTVNLLVVRQTEFGDEITTLPSDTVFYPLAEVDFELWDLLSYQNTDFDASSRARLASEGCLKAGEVVSVLASAQAVSLRSAKPALVLTLSNRRNSLFSWRFQRATGAAAGYFNNFPACTILELMAKTLGTYGDSSSLEALQYLLAHESDTVKWHAADALLRIDVASGEAAFRQLSQSTNTMLRSASTKTVAAISAVTK